MTIYEKNRALAGRSAVWGKLLIVALALVCFGAAKFTRAGDSNRPARPDRAAETNRVLRTVAEVRNLPRAQAEQKLPVKLNGVITYWGPRWICFFSDETGGIFVNVQLA